MLSADTEPGDSPNAGAGSTKGCIGVQSELQKNVANEPEKVPQFNRSHRLVSSTTSAAQAV